MYVDFNNINIGIISSAQWPVTRCKGIGMKEPSK